jgi:hypothetical protein
MLDWQGEDFIEICAVRYTAVQSVEKLTDVSEEYVASIFRIEE